MWLHVTVGQKRSYFEMVLPHCSMISQPYGSRAYNNCEDLCGGLCEDQIIFHTQVSISHSYYTYSLHCTISYWFMCSIIFWYFIWTLYMDGCHFWLMFNYMQRVFCVVVSSRLKQGHCWAGRDVVCSCLLQLNHSWMSHAASKHVYWHHGHPGHPGSSKD